MKRIFEYNEKGQRLRYPLKVRSKILRWGRYRQYCPFYLRVSDRANGSNLKLFKEQSADLTESRSAME